MDKKDEPQRYGAKYKSERVKSRNLSEKKRRDQFNVLINELSTMVTTTSRKMDKSSVLKSAIAFLRTHNEIAVQQQNVEVQENWKPSFLCNEEFTHLMLEALDGFILVFSATGKILYTSESITSLLGYLSSDICSSVFDMVHESDRSSLYKLINTSSENSSPKDSSFSLFVHMKRGPILSQGASPYYELVRLIGSFHHWPATVEGSFSVPTTSNIECDSNSCSSICSPLSSAVNDWPTFFVAMAKLQTPQLLRVVNVTDENKNEFTSRHSLEWTFLFLDHRAPPIIGYLPFEVLGTSGYDYYHVDDLEQVASGHEMLLQTGEGTSGFYRFLTKGQQWVWLQTRYFISYHQWSSKPEFIVCTNFVVSADQVQKNMKKSSKKRNGLLKKVSFSSFALPNATPNQCSCMSPSPSVSSLGSLSSDHSERCHTANSTSSVLAMNAGEEEPPIAVPVEAKKGPLSNKSNSEGYNQALTLQLPTPSLTHHPCSRSPVPVNTISPTVSSFSSMPPTQFHTTTSIANPLTNPSQIQVQDYLQKRQQLLQQQILMQQEELRRVSEQLMLVQFIGNPAPNASSFHSPYGESPVSAVPSLSNSISQQLNLYQSSIVEEAAREGWQLSASPSANACISSQAVPICQAPSPSSVRYASSHSSQHSL